MSALNGDKHASTGNEAKACEERAQPLLPETRIVHPFDYRYCLISSSWAWLLSNFSLAIPALSLRSDVRAQTSSSLH